MSTGLGIDSVRLNRVMVEAIREVLGLKPLYGSDAHKPSPQATSSYYYCRDGNSMTSNRIKDEEWEQ